LLLPYTVLSHTADTGIEATAASFPELLCELATGMFELMGRPQPGSADRAVTVEVDSTDNRELVVDTLSELIYQSEVEDLFFYRFDIATTGPLGVRVTATGVGNTAVELVGPPIKAVTYHDVAAVETEAGWYGRVYFDV
jgi:SHS2 domain-containing protein